MGCSGAAVEAALSLPHEEGTDAEDPKRFDVIC